MSTAARRGNQTGEIIEQPAVDPQGITWPEHVLVRWDTGSVEIVDVADLDPNDDVSRR